LAESRTLAGKPRKSVEAAGARGLAQTLVESRQGTAHVESDDEV